MSWLDIFERDRERTFQPYEGTHLPTWWEWHRWEIASLAAFLLALGCLLALIYWRSHLRTGLVMALAAGLRLRRRAGRSLAGLRSDVEKRAAEK